MREASHRFTQSGRLPNTSGGSRGKVSLITVGGLREQFRGRRRGHPVRLLKVGLMYIRAVKIGMKIPFAKCAALHEIDECPALYERNEGDCTTASEKRRLHKSYRSPGSAIGNKPLVQERNESFASLNLSLLPTPCILPRVKPCGGRSRARKRTGTSCRSVGGDPDGSWAACTRQTAGASP